MNKQEVHNFWKRVFKTEQCWNWTGTRVGGYGQFEMNSGIKIAAHRYSWRLHFGEFDLKLYVCHKCDNPSCVNPNHLFLGTQKANMQDCSAKGRVKAFPTGDSHPFRMNPDIVTRGEKNGMAQLTEKQVSEIKSKYIPYINCSKPSNRRQLALEYGVSEMIISNIIHGRTWRHVE